MKKVLLLIITFLTAFTIMNVNAAAVYDHEVIFNTNGGDYVHSDIVNFGAKLDDSSEPISILTIGDSTSNETDEWLYLFGESLGLQYEQYSVKYKLYNTSANSYNESIDIQYGVDGDAYSLYDGTDGDNITALDNTAFSITGDIDLRAKVEPNILENGTVIGKADGAGLNSYTLAYFSTSATTGKIAITWSEDGTAFLIEDSGEFTVSEDTAVWIKATLDVDNGVGGYTVNYYYSYDGISYTLISTDEDITHGATNIFDSTTPVNLGSYYNGNAGIFEGKIYNIEIRNGIDGQVVGSLDFDNVSSDTQENIRDTEGNIWFINGGVSIGAGSPGLLLLNGSIGGANLSTFTSDILSDLTMLNDIDLIFINLGHNETDDIFVDDLEDFISLVNVFSDESDIVLITQNPQTSPRTATQITQQANRMDQVKLVASRNDMAIVDVYDTLNQDLVTYIGVDGVHPTPQGYIVWADEVFGLLNSRVGAGQSEFTLTVEDAYLINEPDQPTKDGLIFDGWYTNENLTDEWDFSSDLVQEDMVLYANWSGGTTIGGSIISSPDGALELFGIAWYWIAAIGAGAYYFLGTKKGRKSVGFKK
jgi:uncharacterized repeat protein (TIGR02543 family)